MSRITCSSPGHPTASPYTTQPPALLDYLAVINTATNTVVSTFTLAKDPGVFLFHPPPQGVAVNGTSIYVTMWFFDTVSIINGCGLCRITVGSLPISVTITPDGAHAYVANNGSNNISVIATATNTVVATVPVGNSPNAVGIVPPPPGVPFLAFSATLDIAFGAAPNEDFFNLHSPFTLSSTAPAINPVNEPVTLRVGTFSITYPPGSFTKQLDGSFTFAGVINGVSLKAQIYPTGTWTLLSNGSVRFDLDG
jgi:YVTN family beta-propeller protein